MLTGGFGELHWCQQAHVFNPLCTRGESLHKTADTEDQTNETHADNGHNASQSARDCEESYHDYRKPYKRRQGCSEPSSCPSPERIARTHEVIGPELAMAQRIPARRT